MLRVLINLCFIFYLNNLLYFIIYFLIFVVCESVLGLTLLIYLIRSKGNDNIKILNLILW